MANWLSRLFTGSKATSPDGLRVTQFPPAVRELLRTTYYGGGTYQQIYMHQPNVRTVVDTIAREAAELQLKMYMKDPRGKMLPSARIEADDHPAMHVLSEPTPGKSTYLFWYGTFADIAVFDLAIWLIVRGTNTLPEAVLRVPPGTIVPVRDPVTGAITAWRNLRGEYINPDDLIVFWGYDPSNSDGSISPMETLRRMLAEEHAANRDREGMWRNSARKDGVIEQHVEATKMSDEARESFLLDVEDSLAGPQGTGKPLMLDPGMSWNDAQWSPKEAEYVLGRKLNRTEVAAAYHMPPAMVAASEQGTEPDEKTLHFFYTSTLPPYLSRVESDIHAQFLPEFELIPKSRRSFYFEFNLDAKMRGSFEQQAAVMATTAGGPVVTVNEARARLNLPPVPGGDLIYIPLNSMRGGGPQGSPQGPVETPAEGVEPAGTTPGGGVQPQQASLPAPKGGDERSFVSIEAVMNKSEQEDARRKQVEYLVEARERHEERATGVIRKYFDRQLNVVRAGRELKRERWDKELTDDLFGLYYQSTESVGTRISEDIGGTYGTAQTANFLKTHAGLVAKAINDATIRHLVEAEAEKSKARDDDEFGGAFNDERAESNGRDISEYGVNWGVMEAARQFEFRRPFSLQKTWFTTSRTPRLTHAQISGETVGIIEEFGNGLMHPGDPNMGPEEGANCRCVMAVENVK